MEYFFYGAAANSRRVDLFTDRKEVTLEDVVTPYASYEFRIYAVNELGTSSPSENSPQFNVPADVPYVHPQNVSGGGGKIGDLTITWAVRTIYSNFFYQFSDEKILISRYWVCLAASPPRS